MKQILPERVRFFLITYLLFILFFILDKVFFMLYHWHESADAGFYECLRVLVNGFPMDLSMAGYLMIVPGLIIIVSLFITTGLKKALRIYFAVFCFLISLIVIPDMELYSDWGFRMDKTVFTYIVSPKEVLASIPVWMTFIFTVLICLWAYIQYYILCKLALPHFPKEPVKRKLISTPITLLLLGCLFFPIRGGVTASTMNISHVYFSDNVYLNHAALNPIFNMLASLEQTGKLDQLYRFFPDDEAESIFTELMCCESDSFPSLLNTTQPNIVFILLESFGHNVIETLGGVDDAAPCLNEFAEEGILFTNMYANSFRTDRGVVSAFGGYPAQPTMSILKYPTKVQNLNSIPKTLKQNGYHTSMMYGGDINFANIKSFFITQGVTDLTVNKDFTSKENSSDWGVPDHITFQRLSQQIRDEKSYPYLKMFLTLSSHQPFDVPMKRLSDPYFNSVAYTDSCIGAFIYELKESEEWENTLVILVPDHNIRLTEKHYTPNRHHIFMLWLGGAVKSPAHIDRYCSQVDIAAILLAQMGIDYSSFIFSKNILNPAVKEFSFYDFPNGLGMLSPEGRIAYDCSANTILFSEGKNTDSLLIQGKAYLQRLYDDINSK